MKMKSYLIRKLKWEGLSPDDQLKYEIAEELGLLDDEAYARALAREMFERKKFGARRVRQELRQKGIDEETAAAVLAEFAPEPDGARDAIRELVEKKYPAAFGDEKVRRRAVAALQRYGYSFEDIMAVLRAD